MLGLSFVVKQVSASNQTLFLFNDFSFSLDALYFCKSSIQLFMECCCHADGGLVFLITTQIFWISYRNRYIGLFVMHLLVLCCLWSIADILPILVFLQMLFWNMFIGTTLFLQKCFPSIYGPNCLKFRISRDLSSFIVVTLISCLFFFFALFYFTPFLLVTHQLSME